MRLGTNRVNTDTADHASWIYEIIDVVGSNYESYSPKGIRCTARRGDDLPWVSGGPVRRKHENLNIPLTTSFTDLYHHGCLITQNSNVLQMTVLICGLLTETVGSLVCRLLLVRCMLVPPHFSPPTSSLPRQHVKG